MNIAYWLWCWWLAGVYPWFFALEIVEIDPLFIASNNAMQKWLSFETIKQNFTRDFSSFNVSSFKFVRHPFFFFLDLSNGMPASGNSSLVNFQCFSQLLRFWVDSLSSNVCNSASSHFFGGFPWSLLLRSKSPLLKLRNQSLHVVSDKACSPQTFTRIRRLSAAVFF